MERELAQKSRENFEKLQADEKVPPMICGLRIASQCSDFSVT